MRSPKGNWGLLSLSLIAGAGLALPSSVHGQSALRTLPDHYVQGIPSTVSIAIDAPPGTAVVGVEEEPPAGWAVSNISNGGAWDAQSRRVKWGPFFGSSIPTGLSYAVTPPGGASGASCFVGSASFDGLNQSIGGEACIPLAVPALSGLGAIALPGLILAAGVVVLRRSRGGDEKTS